jgi:hypothetical protein
MGIMDMFRSATGNTNAVTGAAPLPGGQQQQGVQPSAQPAGGINNPGNAVVPAAAPGTEGTPPLKDTGIPKNLDKTATIDNFNALWDQPAADKQTPDPSVFKRPNLDPAKLQETFSKMNFVGSVDPQLAAKALAGDSEAFMQVLNSVGQAAFQTSFKAMDGYTGRMFDSYDQSVNARIPKVVGDLESRQLLQSNEGLNHPAVQPLVESVRQQFRQRYPDASPQEIANAANAYFKQVAKFVNTDQSESGNSAAVKSAPQKGRNPVIDDFSNFEIQ